MRGGRSSVVVILAVLIAAVFRSPDLAEETVPVREEVTVVGGSAGASGAGPATGTADASTRFGTRSLGDTSIIATDRP